MSIRLTRFVIGDTLKHTFAENEISVDWPCNIPSFISLVAGANDYRCKVIYLLNGHDGVHYNSSELKRVKALLIEKCFVNNEF